MFGPKARGIDPFYNILPLIQSSPPCPETSLPAQMQSGLVLIRSMVERQWMITVARSTVFLNRMTATRVSLKSASGPPAAHSQHQLFGTVQPHDTSVSRTMQCCNPSPSLSFIFDCEMHPEKRLFHAASACICLLRLLKIPTQS